MRRRPSRRVPPRYPAPRDRRDVVLYADRRPATLPDLAVRGVLVAGRAAVRGATAQRRAAREAAEAEAQRTADRTAIARAVRDGLGGVALPTVEAVAQGRVITPDGQPVRGTVVPDPADDPRNRSWRFRNRRALRTYWVAVALFVARCLAHWWPTGGLCAFTLLAIGAAAWFAMVAKHWRYDRPVNADSSITIAGRTVTGPVVRGMLRTRNRWTPRIGVLAAVAAVTVWLAAAPWGRSAVWLAIGATTAAAIRWHRFRIRKVEVVEAEPVEDGSLSGRWLNHITPEPGLLRGSCVNPDPDTFRADPATDTTVAEILTGSKIHARQVLGGAGTLKLLIERCLDLPDGSVRLKIAGRAADRVTLIISMADHMRVHAVDWAGPIVYEGADGCWYAVLGEEEDGTSVELILADRDGVKHILNVGSTGAGKTGTGNLVLLAVAQIACIIYLDGKQGDSAPHLTGAMWARCVTPGQMRAAISWLYQVMKKRQAARGRDGTGGRWRQGHETIGPTYCLYMEEAAGINRQIAGLIDPATGLKYEQEILEMGEQARALGIIIAAALHNPSADKMPGGKDLRGFLRTGGNAILLRQLDPTTARLAAEGCDEAVFNHLKALPEDPGWAVYLRHGKLRSPKYRHQWARDDPAKAEADRMRAEGRLIAPSQFDIDASVDAYAKMMADPWGDAPTQVETPATGDELDGSDRLLLFVLLAGENGRLPDVTNGVITGCHPAAGHWRLGAIEDVVSDPGILTAWLGEEAAQHAISRRTISGRLGFLRAAGLTDKAKPDGRRYYLWHLTDAGRGLVQQESAGWTEPGGGATDEDNCPSCGVALGTPHAAGCAVADCGTCGGARADCAAEHPDGGGATWTGQWPGAVECWEAGLAVREVSPGQWEPCDPAEDGALPDFERLRDHATWDPDRRRWLLLEHAASGARPNTEGPTNG